MEDYVKNYLDTFGELPMMPMLLDYAVIKDLMIEAVISKVPLTPEQIYERVTEDGEPWDLA